MIQLDARFNQLRLWLDEPLPWPLAHNLASVRMLPLINNNPNFASYRQVGVELFKPLGARFEYGGLSASFTIERNSHNFSVEFMKYGDIAKLNGTLLHEKLGTPITKIDPDIFLYLVDGINSVKDLLVGGKMTITGGAYDDVGTSGNVYYKLGRILTILLLKNIDVQSESESLFGLLE